MKVACQTHLWETLPEPTRHGWVRHVRSFQVWPFGFFVDHVLCAAADRRVRRRGFWRRDWVVRRAETRQAAAALLGAGASPAWPVRAVPGTAGGIRRYLKRLPWDCDPWAAGSHTSHLGFFLALNAKVFGRTTARDALMPVLLDWLDGIQDERTGSWHALGAAPPRNQQVNAAMKVLTLFRWLDRPIRFADRLVDLCLVEEDARDACHSVDVLFVLSETARWTPHRAGEIRDYATAILRRIHSHIREDGAFSFLPDRANDTYYGLRVSRGFTESDVHGTHLLTWAVTLCAGLLGMEAELGWSPPVT
jgi:hypothetical protein